MPRDPISIWCFALVVVRKGPRFLLVQERKHGQNWYFPAGRVEPGESFVDGAVRETLEEAGVPVHMTGIIRVEHTPSGHGTRLRVVFAAEPLDDTPPKSTPDDESLGAAWFTIEEARRLPLRGGEVIELLRYVEQGGRIHSLSLLQQEGRPYMPD